MSKTILGSNYITAFILNGREETLLVGDYSLYANRLTKRVLAARKRLGLATPKGAKFKKAEALTAEQIAEKPEYIQLILLNAERCWAKAMYTKSIQPEDTTITGSNRKHIIDKLHQAGQHAWSLYSLLLDRATSGAAELDVLQVRAYHASLVGAEEYEKQSEGQKSSVTLAKRERWNRCLRSYATTRIIYTALASTLPKELFHDFITNTVDPMLRYVAHQARLSRTVAVSSVAISHFPIYDADLVRAVTALDADVLTDQKPAVTRQQDHSASSQSHSRAESAAQAPSQITWRGIDADIVDATIGQALAQVTVAARTLSVKLSSRPEASDSDKAALFDEVLLASQDVTDAAKRATDELEREGVDESDARIQDLRVTNLYAQHELISWRVGRNRVLTGQHDGLDLEPDDGHRTKRRKTANNEPKSKKLARMRQHLVLYDATIQSIQSIKSIRGAQRDGTFVAELDAKVAYFEALKCITIALSHAIYQNHTNALALLVRAAELAKISSSTTTNTSPSTSLSVARLDISRSCVEAVQSHISRSIQRHQALSEMEQSHLQAQKSEKHTRTAPLIERMGQFPAPGTSVDLAGLVTYPPRYTTLPVKPIFLDVAWNYIDYPGRTKVMEVSGAGAGNGVAASTVSGSDGRIADTGSPITPSSEGKKEKKGGWFGFGRS